MHDSERRHYLVTGGAGFIGSHLVEALLKRGDAVTALDNLVTGRKDNFETFAKSFGPEVFQFIEADVSKGIPNVPLIRDFGLHAVLHFACPASPVDFEKIPIEILLVDSFGTHYCSELALKAGARLVVASTSEVYGDPLEHPQKETYWGNVNPVGPRSCYDETKRFAEAYVTSARKKLGLNSGIVRIFNTYGPRMRPDDGRIVPELCLQALKNQPLTIHGDGTQTRSFCYVDDLVRGILAYADSEMSEPCNLGNPVERSVMEFAQAVRKLAGSQSDIRHLPARQDDPKRRRPDISRARENLNWEPRVDFEEGLMRTIEYFRTFSL